jgi:uncharacterized RDD family membrane protein YckC
MWPTIGPALGAYFNTPLDSPAEAKAYMVLFEVAVIHAIIRATYAIILEGSHFHATLGKMAMGVVVTNKHGAKPGLFTVIMRNTLGRLALNLIPFYAGYSLLMFNKEKKGLHDMISGSMVCTKAPLAQSSVSEVFA